MEELAHFRKEKVHYDQQLADIQQKLATKEQAERELNDTKRQLEFQMQELHKLLEKSDKSRHSLREEMDQLNAKTIELEEELYEAKMMKNELLNDLQQNEDKLEHALIENDKLLLDNERLAKEAEEACNQIYYADKKDEVDQALGKYLNTYPER